MVQYAIIQHFYQKSGKSWNSHLLVIFKVMHVISSYISQNVHRTMKVVASISSALRIFSMGVLCYFPKYSILVAIISQLVKKLQQWSLYEVIEDILSFVLNTKRPLSDIWLLRYKQNSFGCFQRNSEVRFFQKTLKLFCL